MYYHFENKKGWMNDPNGLCYFKGKYHAFFQHYPYASRWGQMHWGHAVSTNLIDWEELDIALYPDQPYENSGGCFSGSAIVKDNRMYLFYTSVSEEMEQTQSMAYSDDGVNFIKYDKNPIIRESPLGSNKDFRDPKVFEYKDDSQYSYRMIVGAGIDGVGKILLYKSSDLLNWVYCSELVSDANKGPCIECPNLFQVTSEADRCYETQSSKFYDIYAELGTEPPKPSEDCVCNSKKWVLMYSVISGVPSHVCFELGSFDGEEFVIEGDSFPIEVGPDLYAPQVFESIDGRAILIAWMYNWQKRPREGAQHVGAFTIPRELWINHEQRLIMKPIREIRSRIKSESSFVKYDRGRLEISFQGTRFWDKAYKEEPQLEILEDVGVVEVFINGGEETATVYVC